MSKIFDKVTGQVMAKGSKLSKFLTPEEKEFADKLPDVTVSNKDLKQQEKDGFSELKEDFKAVKVYIIQNLQHHNLYQNFNIVKQLMNYLLRVNLLVWRTCSLAYIICQGVQ